MLVLSVEQYLIAEELLFKTTEKANVFLDAQNKSQILVLGEKSKYVWSLDASAELYKLTVLDDECNDKSMVYRHPFLVSPELTCLIDGERRLSLVAKTEPRKNHFSFAYIHEDAKYQYYLFNGREIPSAEAGYLQLKKVRLIDGQSTVKDWLEGVPYYSGAVASDLVKDRFYITVAQPNTVNELYSVGIKEILKSIEVGEKASFKDFFDAPITSFKGLSFRLFVSQQGSFFYDNRSEYGDFDSVYIKPDKQAQMTKLKPKCQAQAFIGTALLTLCDDQNLLLVDLEP